jgi:Bacterial transglutaminase-like cysteine proteinase BTLCP
MGASKRTSRLKALWTGVRLGRAYLPSKDPWVSVDADIPLNLFGSGSVREFTWYFEGESAVPVRDVPGVCEWLRGCDYVDDARLFQVDDFWQHPCTFEQLRRGDCEDHALWAWRKLCELGIQAEFVCGRWIANVTSGANGHAWVVFHDTTGSYLLDPVIKEGNSMVRPLQEARSDYRPEVSVDQQFARKIYGGRFSSILELREERKSAYSELQIERILTTINKLERRIAERFPGQGLHRICVELGRVAHEAGAEVEHLRRPIWLLRIGVGLSILGIVAIVFGIVTVVAPGAHVGTALTELVVASEAAVNEVILLAIAIFFMLSLETRARRRTALKSLHRLRSIVHIVDMHQLTKDPEYLLSPEMLTTSSPERSMTRFELSRYLDYCSELFSLTSKVAALYAQHLRDPVILDAVNDIETLAASLSNKVWQKIMILDTTNSELITQRTPAPPPPEAPQSPSIRHRS